VGTAAGAVGKEVWKRLVDETGFSLFYSLASIFGIIWRFDSNMGLE
jgi:hypothetical protein